ncbi:MULTISPECIES: putative toxin-antitoxin system toxin component, PIN family [Fischerella]|uniref:putative toxin-antitoxin system toxin component, PIN family n=1 Tax=Fischerella TaxID=1190 RepID=UPI0002E06CDD|nr:MULTISPECIES: putative toxin-antitoxin system toxin component, PIN family [Fischerella]
MISYVVVFDTNTLFSGLGWRGSRYRCLELARNGQIESVTCREILLELREKLQTKQNRSPVDAAIDIEQILVFSRLVEIPNSLKVVVDDPDDDMVIECAVVGKATHIITGDKHLLTFNKYQDIHILKAAAFLELLA